MFVDMSTSFVSQVLKDVLKTIVWFGAPIVQIAVLGGKVTKLSAQLTTELVGAWARVGAAAEVAGAAEMAAASIHMPVGLGGAVAGEEKVSALRGRMQGDLAASQQASHIKVLSVASMLNIGTMAYEAMQGTEVDKEMVREHPNLAESMTAAEYANLPDRIGIAVPILGITGDQQHPGWLERNTRRDPNSAWYDPHHWLGYDPSDASRDAKLHFKAESPDSRATLRPLPAPYDLTPLPPPGQAAVPTFRAESEGGRTDIYLHIPNLPAGTMVETNIKGNGPNVKTNLGEAWMGGLY